MVFRPLSKWARPAKEATHPLSIVHAPDELVLLILNNLDLQDVLNLRLTCRDFTILANEILKARLKCLYIHPTTTSLRRTIEICRHPTLGQKIEEVVLLTFYRWAEDTKPWPAYLPSACRRVGRASKTSILDPSEGLWKFLKNLPNLHKLSYAKHCDTPGFNKVPQSQLASHARRCLDANYETLRRIPGGWFTVKPLKHPKWPTLKAWNDIDVLFHLLTYGRFTMLSLPLEMPACEAWTHTLSTTTPSNLVICDKLSALTVFETGLYCGYEDRRWNFFCQQILRHAPNLNRLVLNLLPGYTGPITRVEFVLSNILSGFAGSLKHFALVALPLAEETEQKRSQPVCLKYDLNSFIASQTELEQLNLTNVLFFTPTRGPKEAFKCLLEHLRARPLHANVTLNKYTIHPHCTYCDGSSGWPECVYDCSVYTGTGLPELSLTSHYLHLADELGVRAVGNKWDFSNFANGADVVWVVPWSHLNSMI